MNTKVWIAAKALSILIWLNVCMYPFRLMSFSKFTFAFCIYLCSLPDAIQSICSRMEHTRNHIRQNAVAVNA